MSQQPFVWRALDKEGIIQSGNSVGDKKSGVQKQLIADGYFPIEIHARRNWKTTVFPTRLNLQWNHFARRLATLLEAGIPLLQSLEIITSYIEKPTPQLLKWKSVRESVETGSDLSEALAYLEPAPNTFVLAMIKAGEYTGALGQILSEVADELDQEQSYKKKIRAALSYPILILSAVATVLFVLSVWVLPMYEKLFVSMGAELPVLTMVIFSLGRKIPVLLCVGFGLIAGIVLIFKLTSQRPWKIRIGRWLERFPFIGTVYWLHDLVQFSRILGRLLSAGIPLLEALRLTGETLRSQELHELMNQLMMNVRKGESMAPVLRLSRVFPKEGAEMIAVAEESGQLERMLFYVTQMFRRQFEERLNLYERMIEPALILMLAGLIGLIASGIMLPIFDLSSHIE